MFKPFNRRKGRSYRPDVERGHVTGRSLGEGACPPSLPLSPSISLSRSLALSPPVSLPLSLPIPSSPSISLPVPDKLLLFESQRSVSSCAVTLSAVSGPTLATMGFSVCLLLLSVVSALEDQVKVKPGEDAALPCQSPGGAAVVVLEWIRPELHDDGYVFLYRNNRSYERYQHPAFRGRVQLREAALKDGDASVILKKVDVNDTGTYKCQIIVIDPGSDETSHVRHLVNLEVTDSGSTGGQTGEGGDEEGGDEDGGNTEKSIKNEEKKFGHVGLAVGLSVFGVLFIVCLIVMFRKTVTFTKRLKPRYQPPPKAEVSAAS